MLASDAMVPIIAIVIVVFIALAIYGAMAAKKRRQALAAWAQANGLRFDPSNDAALDERYPQFKCLRQGDDRYGYDRIFGQWKGRELLGFDYHYETHSTDSKGHRQTHRHYFSCFLLHLPRSFPELAVGREGFFSKIAQAFGYDDIDFESHEFSRKFCVRSSNKKFAYDVCNARMMEYLLANDDLTIEIDQDVLAITFDSRLDLARIEPNLSRLITLRSLMPDYLFSELPKNGG